MPANPSPAPHRRPRLKTVLLGAAGAALVLAPLGQVLQFQTAELRELAAQRAALDPLTVAVGVQRGLLAHRDVADRVLRGRSALEAERRERQAELDARVRHLQDTLAAGFWVRALQESHSLAGDWRQLARRVTLRQIAPAENLEAHQLLQEQAVQVLDLVQAAAPSPTATLVAQMIPRAYGPDTAHSADLQVPLAALDRALQAQDAQLAAGEARVREQRNLLAAAVVAGLALLLAWALRRALQPAPDGGNPAPADEAVDERRSHGRRATDAAPQRDEAAPLLQRLRRGNLPSTHEPG